MFIGGISTSMSRCCGVLERTSMSFAEAAIGAHAAHRPLPLQSLLSTTRTNAMPVSGGRTPP